MGALVGLCHRAGRHQQLRVQWLQPEDLATWLEVVLGVGSMALVAAAVTAVWRAARG